MPKSAKDVAVLKITTVHVEMQTTEITFNEQTKLYSITISTTEKSSITILKKMIEN